MKSYESLVGDLVGNYYLLVDCLGRKLQLEGLDVPEPLLVAKIDKKLSDLLEKSWNVYPRWGQRHLPSVN